MQLWEYRIIRVHRVSWEDAATRDVLGRREETSAVFNALGREGWELVGMGYDATGDLATATFKRPMQSAEAS